MTILPPAERPSTAAIPSLQHTCAARCLARLDAAGTKFAHCKPLARTFEIMATETNKSGELYVKIVGTLMVILIGYGALSLMGVVR
jgi:hypothetical protein